MADNLREYVPCNLCGSNNHRHYASGRNRLWPSEVFQVVKCNGCGLVFLNPRPAAIEPRLRNRPFDPGLAPKPEDEQLWRARLTEWSCLIEPLVAGRKLLDWGCGFGQFWSAARQSGWDAYGCDISTELIAAAGDYWQTDRLFPATMEELTQHYANYFDVVNSSQVFEHLSDPQRTARGLQTVLKPGGVLAIDVPNLDVWRERFRKGSILDVPAHFYYFSPKTIRRLLKDCGYQVAGVWSGTAALRWLVRSRSAMFAGRTAAQFRKSSRGGGVIQVVAVKPARKHS